MLATMMVLALDTTGRTGSVALWRDGRLVAARAGDPARPHGQRLPGEIAAVLAEHGLDTAGVNLYAVAAGPGSFTGLRVGIATIQGLALTNDRRVVAVPSLEALAYAARAAAGARPIGAWIDGGRHEVFAALYRVAPDADPATGLVEIAPAAVGSAAEILRQWDGLVRLGDVLFAGDGAAAYASVIHGWPSAACADRLADTPLLAPAVAEIAAARAARGGAVRPHAIVPVYVRRPDAELARDGGREPL